MPADTLTVRYEILAKPTDTRPAGILKPRTQPIPTVEWSGSNAVGRTLSGVTLDPTEAAKIIEGRHWIRPRVNDRPVGVFRYLGKQEQRLPAGITITVDTCPDRTHQLDVELDDPIDCEVGESLTDFLIELYGRAGFPEAELDIVASTATAGALLSFASGGPHIIEIAVQVHELLGYLPPHIDRNGRPQIRPVPNPELLRPTSTLVYAPGAGSKIRNGSVRIATSVRSSPNIYIVRSTSPTGQPVSARYPIPAESPNSLKNLGYPRPRTTDLPGLADDAQALEVARAQARSDALVVRTVEFASTPNPEHDAWDVVSWESDRMLEHAWTLPLGVGEMTHVFKTAYANG